MMNFCKTASCYRYLGNIKVISNRYFKTIKVLTKNNHQLKSFYDNCCLSKHGHHVLYVKYYL